MNEIDIFAELEPNQKERVILALKKAAMWSATWGTGSTMPLPSMRQTSGISVESGVDVAKEAADIVLLEKDLDVLLDGVREGRATFANT